MTGHAMSSEVKKLGESQKRFLGGTQRTAVQLNDSGKLKNSIDMKKKILDFAFPNSATTLKQRVEAGMLKRPFVKPVP